MNKKALLWIPLVLGALLVVACATDDDTQPIVCEAGTCDSVVTCETECVKVCDSPTIGNVDCTEGVCTCECFGTCI